MRSSGGEGDEDGVAAPAGLAENVAVWIEMTEKTHQPVVYFENTGDAPVYGLAVYCFHFAGVLSGSYSYDEPHQGRQTLTRFTDALARWYGSDDGGEMARQAQFVAAYAFRDALGHWWCRRADGTLVGAKDEDEANRAAFLSAPSDRSGPQLWTIVN